MTSQIATVGQIAASAGGSSTPSASVIMAEASAGTQHVLKKASSTSNPPQPSSSSPEVRPTPTHHSVLISLTSGAVAGAVAKTVIAPLDRTKIYFQTHPERSYRLKRAFKYIHTTYQTQVRHNLIVHYTARKRVTCVSFHMASVISNSCGVFFTRLASLVNFKSEAVTNRLIRRFQQNPTTYRLIPAKNYSVD